MAIAIGRAVKPKHKQKQIITYTSVVNHQTQRTGPGSSVDRVSASGYGRSLSVTIGGRGFDPRL